MKKRHGFTILEALIALMIGGIGLVGAVVATINCAGYVKASTHRIVAQGIAQGEIGKMRVLGYSKVLNQVGTTENQITIDEGDPNKSNDSLQGVIIRNVQTLDLDGDGYTDILNLEVTLEWDEFGRRYQQRSSSLLTKRSF